MLSILIPVYEFDVRALVYALHEQGQSLGVPVEIRCYDDGSSEALRSMNRALGTLSGVVYREMETNLGRSAIRNRLALDAQYPYLLFMDGDAGVVDGAYLRRYLDVATPEAVVVGGTAYLTEPPEQPEQLLRWQYGREREQQKAAERNERALLGFSTFNFLIPAEIFSRVQFNERMRGYGHEDTLFGCELKRLGIAIRHIDNPLYHLGLDTGAVFLEKTRQGVQNLFQVQNHCPGFDTRLLRSLRWVRRLGLARPARVVLRLLRSWMEAQLLGLKPSIRMLDWYKLGWGLEYAADS